jgi:hypothetical protein
MAHRVHLTATWNVCKGRESLRAPVESRTAAPTECTTPSPLRSMISVAKSTSSRSDESSTRASVAMPRKYTSTATYRRFEVTSEGPSRPPACASSRSTREASSFLSVPRTAMHHEAVATGPLLLRKGRVLTPGSRLTYRLQRIRAGKVAGFETGDEAITIAALLLRLASLPLLTLFDYIAWPVVRRTLGRGSWWVVDVRFHGPDAEFVRIAESSTYAAAQARLTALSKARSK